MGFSPRHLVFDLDETMYPRGAGVMEEVKRLILRYMTERLAMPPDTATQLRRRYLLQYGTTMAGLVRHERIDPDDYLHYVHDFSPSDYLGPNRELDHVLDSIDLQKTIWTNGTHEHAVRVLRALHIGHHFGTIVDVRDMGYVSKPASAVYALLLDSLGASGNQCVLVEDSLRNLRPAKTYGMWTVLVDGDADGSVDIAIARVEQIGDALADLQRAGSVQEESAFSNG